VALPKFKMTTEFQLKKTLSEMGMPMAFTGSADFSAMNGGKESFFLGSVIHKAFVDVNEGRHRGRGRHGGRGAHQVGPPGEAGVPCRSSLCLRDP